MTRESKQLVTLTLTLIVAYCAVLRAAETATAVPSGQQSLQIPATDEGLPGAGPIRRADWFQNVWTQRRRAWADQIEKDQGAVVLLGDSITQGWRNVDQSFPNLKIANRGISGDTTRGMLIRLRQDVLALNPRGVVLLMGTNDLEEQAEPETIAGNVKLILAALQEHNPTMPMVLCQVFPSSASKQRPAAKIRKVNRLYAELVKDKTQVRLLDTWTLFANDQGDAKPEEFPDLLHPNGAGYAKWAAALRPILATLGFVETEPEPFEIEPGFESLFNGRDLTGWGLRPSSEADKQSKNRWRASDPQAPPWPIVSRSKSFHGKPASDDGRYVAKNGRLIVTTPSEGRRIQQLWTTRDFPFDFDLKLEFRATPNADSGVFLRGKQLQCRDYLTAGPYKQLENYEPQEWNELHVVVKDNVARCTCNGEIIEEMFAVPDTGPIGLEGDRGQVEYRRIRIHRTSPHESSPSPRNDAGTRTSTGSLPRSSPEAQGVSSLAILDFVEAADKIDAMNSFMLVRHGCVVAEGWWSPYAADDPHMLYSLSKSFTSTAVGMAIDEGKLSLDDRVLAFFPDDAPDNPSGNLNSMRVRDLLSMSTGHVQREIGKFSFDSKDRLTKLFLALEVTHKPGTHFVYNTPATYMCSAIVQEVTGQKVIDYLRPRLFDPLGIQDPTWSESADGISHGGFGLSVRTEDIARFGQLYLQRGEWHGKRLISPDWIAAATMRQTSNGSNPNSDWEQGYGYQFWRCRHGAFRGDGAFGQYCIVIPEQDTVVAITSGVKNMQSVMQLVWNKLLPALAPVALPEDPDMQASLAARLAELRLATPMGTPSSALAAEVHGRTYRFAENGRQIESISFEFGSETSTLIVRDDQGEHQIPIGNQSWGKRRLPALGRLDQRGPSGADIGAAASGAWTSEDTYAVRLCLFETPFYQDLTFQFSNDADDVSVASDYNVWFGRTSQPRITGQAKP